MRQSYVNLTLFLEKYWNLPSILWYVFAFLESTHTPYSRKNSCQKCGGKWLPQFFSYFQDLNYFNQNPKMTNTPTFLTHIISAVGGVNSQNNPKCCIMNEWMKQNWKKKVSGFAMAANKDYVKTDLYKRSQFTFLLSIK